MLKRIKLSIIVVIVGSYLSNAQEIATLTSASNLNSDSLVTLTFTEGTGGGVSVHRTSVYTDSTYKPSSFVVEHEVYGIWSMPNDTIFVNYTPLPTGYKVFWLPIDLDVPPIINTGSGFKFWCADCPSCDIELLSIGSCTKMSCNKSCCTLYKKEVGGTALPDQIGVLIVAKSITYN